MNSDEILKQVGRIIRETIQCGPVEITRATRAIDVRGWDSLSHTMILLQLEEGFNVRLPMDRVLRVGNAGGIADLIEELLSPGKVSPGLPGNGCRCLRSIAPTGSAFSRMVADHAGCAESDLGPGA